MTINQDPECDTAYTAVVTITAEGKSARAFVQIELEPTDAVSLSDGRVRPLRDCTLADLNAFAEALETELWSSLSAVRLAELIDSSTVDVAVQLVATTETAVMSETEERPDLTQLLERAIVLEDEAAAAATDTHTEPSLDDSDDDEGDAADDVTPADESRGAAEEYQPSAPRPPSEQPELELAEGRGNQIRTPETTSTSPDEQLDEPPQADEQSVDKELVLKREPRSDLKKRRILGRRRPMHHPTWTAADILINESAFRDAQAHALSSLEREVAGMLIGPPAEKQPDGRYLVHVTDIIIARHTRMQGASVTYTPESWRYVHDRLNERYPDEEAVILGWYHTHPGFGIFLSGMDRFIHENFFTQLWHVALVLDPLNRRSGFFCWDRGRSRVDAYEFPWPNWASGSW